RSCRPPTSPLFPYTTLFRSSGEHLNREAVEAFVSMVEVFPVGVHVRFGSGKYAGCYGVVVACFSTSPNRPLVRLLFDPNGLPIRSEEHTSELQSRGHLVCRL